MKCTVTVEPLYKGHCCNLRSWLPCRKRCPLFRGKFVQSSPWLRLQTVSSLERCPLFRVSFIERFHSTSYCTQPVLICLFTPVCKSCSCWYFIGVVVLVMFQALPLPLSPPAVPRLFPSTLPSAQPPYRSPSASRVKCQCPSPSSNQVHSSSGRKAR